MKDWLKISDIEKMRKPLVITDKCPVCKKEISSDIDHTYINWSMTHFSCKWKYEKKHLNKKKLYIFEDIQDWVLGLKEDIGEISDWYHTFNELYKHRIHLFIALCKLYLDDSNELWFNHSWVKSKKHHDGSSFDWWFIIQLETEYWQISYHIPNEYWNKCDFIETVDKAPKWDWHTSDDVLDRLLRM